MANTFTAPFAQFPKTATAVTTAVCVIGTADAPTNTVELLTAGPDGAILTNLSVMPRATVSASSLLLFLSKDGGTTKRLVDSEVLPAQSISTTVKINKVTFPRYSEVTPMRLAAGDKLFVATQVASAAGLVFEAEYTDF